MGPRPLASGNPEYTTMLKVKYTHNKLGPMLYPTPWKILDLLLHNISNNSYEVKCLVHYLTINTWSVTLFQFDFLGNQ